MKYIWTPTTFEKCFRRTIEQIAFAFLTSMVTMSITKVNAQNSTNKSDLQISVDLLKGSRIVGKIPDEMVEFSSLSLGDIKLPLVKIRTVKMAGKNSGEANLVRVTKINNDVLEAKLLTHIIHVETDFGKVELPANLLQCIQIKPTVQESLNQTTSAVTTSQMAIGLKDGSYFSGDGPEQTLEMHSSVLGDFKLNSMNIRSIEFRGTNDMACVTATDGSVFNAMFITPKIHIVTDFNKNEIPFHLIHSIKISHAQNADPLVSDFPQGLIGFWSGDGNGGDSVGANDAIVSKSMQYGPTENGLGFQFENSTTTVRIPASTTLDVGKGGGFTLSCWIMPDSASDDEPLMEWSGSKNGSGDTSRWGVHFWISSPGAGDNSGDIYANILDSNGSPHSFSTAPGIITPGVLQQVALTYDNLTGIGKIYYNGSMLTSNILGNFTPKTDTSLLIGERLDGYGKHFHGTINNICIFNKTLSDEEIKSLYDNQK